MVRTTFATISRDFILLRWQTLFLVLFFLAGCGSREGHGPAGGGMPPVAVGVITIQPQTIPVNFEYPAQTAASREVEIRSRAIGIIQKRNYVEGAVVKAGQSLFTIDPAPFEASLSRADADLSAAQARYDQALRTSMRLKPLWDARAVSQKEYDDAVSAEQIAAADIKAARARVQEARLNLAYTRVESPITGLTSRALKSEGSLISGPDVLLTTVIQTNPIYVNFGIADNEQMKLENDAVAGRITRPADGKYDVEVKLADGTVFSRTGKLTFSDTRINTTTGTSDARAELPNPDAKIRPGQFVRLTVKGAVRQNAIVIPQRAVLEGPQGKFVYVVGADNKAEVRPVETGDWSGDQWVILKGLSPRDKVIIDGMARIFAPGTPVQIADAPAVKSLSPESDPPASKGSDAAKNTSSASSTKK